MEKVKLTKKQADSLEYLKSLWKGTPAKKLNFILIGEKLDKEYHWDNEADEIPDADFIEALHFGYEVEPEYQCGEWIAYKRPDGTTIIAKIVEVEDDSVLTDYQVAGFDQRFYFPSIRHATPEEIKQEKERRWWERHDRDVWELIKGDTLKNTKNYLIYEVVDVDSEGNVAFINDIGFRDKGLIKRGYKVHCFAESRLDRGDEHA